MTVGGPVESRAEADPRGGRDPAGFSDVAVLVPCYAEATTIAQVVRDFRASLPGATVYVFDNNSPDATASQAAEAGAVVRRETHQGKGNVVRRMFADVEAEIYVLVDGDATYEAAAAPAMVRLLREERLDMVSGARRAEAGAAWRAGHRFGNRLLTGLVRLAFGRAFDDMLSGYRVMSRRFVKSFPATSQGFEIETELTVHALQMRLPVAEVATAYRARPAGSTSKLGTVRDGLRILLMIGLLVREEKPLLVFGTAAALLFSASAVLVAPVLREYYATGLVPRLPTFVAATAAFVAALLSLACGLILDTVARARLEQRRLAYLALPPPGERRRGAAYS